MLPDNEESRTMLRENARSWVVEGSVIAIIGVSRFWKGVGVVWTLLSDESRQRGVALTRGARKQLDMLFEERGYWRIQATIEHGDEEARQWITSLQFGYEGTMREYGPGRETHDMYARLGA